MKKTRVILFLAVILAAGLSIWHEYGGTTIAGPGAPLVSTDSVQSVSRDDHGNDAEVDPVSGAPSAGSPAHTPPGPRSGRTAASTDRTPSEHALLAGNALAIESAERVLASRHFDRFMQVFAREATSGEALDLTALYAEAARKLLPGDGEARLVDLQCGTTLCIGRIRSRARDAYRKWSDAFGNSRSTPHYSYIDRTIALAADEFEHRFIFSTDPAANAVTVSLHSVPKP